MRSGIFWFCFYSTSSDMVDVKVVSAGLVLHTTGEETKDDMEVEVDRELWDKLGGIAVGVVDGMTHTGRAVFNPRGEASLRKSSLARSSYM